MSKIMIKHKNALQRIISFGVVSFPSMCFASAPKVNLSEATSNLTSVVGNLSSLALAIAFICGLGFGISAMMKFKKHKDNPQQMPLSTPVTELCLAVALLFIPAISKIAGHSIFGGGALLSSHTGQPVPVQNPSYAPQITHVAPAPPTPAPAHAPQQQQPAAPDAAPQQQPAPPAPEGSHQRSILDDYGVQ